MVLLPARKREPREPNPERAEGEDHRAPPPLPRAQAPSEPLLLLLSTGMRPPPFCPSCLELVFLTSTPKGPGHHTATPLSSCMGRRCPRQALWPGA